MAELRGPGRIAIELSVNGAMYDLYIEPRRTLLDALRDDLGLMGTKKVCNQGECGACSVLVEGTLVYSCLTLAIECQGKNVRTIESLHADPVMQKVQQAFIEHDGYQCGFCTPGQVMAVTALVKTNTDPKIEEVKRAVSGNLCRCGAYRKIFKAAVKAADLVRQERDG